MKVEKLSLRVPRRALAVAESVQLKVCDAPLSDFTAD